MVQHAGGGAAAAGRGHGAAHPQQPPDTPSQGAGAGQVRGRLELQTKVREDFTVTNRAFTLLGHYVKQVLTG